jgi:hypothetical protein
MNVTWCNYLYFTVQRVKQIVPCNFNYALHYKLQTILTVLIKLSGYC